MTSTSFKTRLVIKIRLWKKKSFVRKTWIGIKVKKFWHIYNRIPTKTFSTVPAFCNLESSEISRATRTQWYHLESEGPKSKVARRKNHCHQHAHPSGVLSPQPPRSWRHRTWDHWAFALPPFMATLWGIKSFWRQKRVTGALFRWLWGKTKQCGSVLCKTWIASDKWRY